MLSKLILAAALVGLAAGEIEKKSEKQHTVPHKKNTIFFSYSGCTCPAGGRPFADFISTTDGAKVRDDVRPKIDAIIQRQYTTADAVVLSLDVRSSHKKNDGNSN